MIHTSGLGKFPLIAACAGLALTGLLLSPARAEPLVRRAIGPPENNCTASACLNGSGQAGLLGYAAYSQVGRPSRARRRSARPGTPSDAVAETSIMDVLFHPIGLAPALTIFSPHAAGKSSGSGNNGGTSPSGNLPGYPTGSQGSNGGDPQSGSSPSGNPPLNHTPEPATLVSGLIGVGLLGLARWRRRGVRALGTGRSTV